MLAKGIRCALLCSMLCAAPLYAIGGVAEPGSSGDQMFADALHSGDLICDFPTGYARDLFASLGQRVPRRGLMLVYESIDPARQRAQVVSTHSAGRKPVVTRRTGKAVHLIETQYGSVRVTAITACVDRRMKHGVETCVRFAAQHVWHFDGTVLADPDASYARQARGAVEGSCEPWTLD